MVVHDLAHQAQSNTRSILLGRKEWYENLVKKLLLYAGPIVFDGLLGIIITIAATMIGIWRSLKQNLTEVLNQV